MKVVGKVVILCLYLLVVAIFYSKYLLSVAMIVMTASAIYRKVIEKTPIKLNSFAPYLAVILIFVATLISGINSEDLGEWISRMRMKLPFLFLPFAFYIHRDIVARELHRLAFFFLIVAFVSLAGLIPQMTNMESVIATIAKGQSFETPVDHIRYSLYLAYAVLIGIILTVEKKEPFFKYDRVVIAFLGLTIFLFLHILAVRSGLAVFYLSSILLLMRYAWKYKLRYMYLIVGLLLISPYIAYKTVPSFKKKWEYMKYDFQMFQQGKGAQHSDSERLYSYQVGLELFKESPIMGTGVGDFKADCKKMYKKLFDIENSKYPHNQYLFYLAGSGLVGFGLFLFGMFYPAFHFRKKLGSYFLVIWVVFLISFLVENSIERSYSIAFYLFFILAGMCSMSTNYSMSSIVDKPQFK